MDVPDNNYMSHHIAEANALLNSRLKFVMSNDKTVRWLSPKYYEDKGRILNPETLRFDAEMPLKDAQALVEIFSKSNEYNGRGIGFSLIMNEDTAVFSIPLKVVAQKRFAEFLPENISEVIEKNKTESRVRSERPKKYNIPPAEYNPPSDEEKTLTRLSWYVTIGKWELQPEQDVAKDDVQHYRLPLPKEDAFALARILEENGNLSDYNIHLAAGRSTDETATLNIPVWATKRDHFWKHFPVVTMQNMRDAKLSNVTPEEIEAHLKRNPVVPVDPDVRRYQRFIETGRAKDPDAGYEEWLRQQKQNGGKQEGL